MVRRSRCAIPVVMLVLAACAGTEPTPSAARVDAAAVRANPYSVLSAVVVAKGLGDSAAVRFRVPTQASDSTTPAFAFAGDSVVVPVLGLLAGTPYLMRVVVWGGADSAQQDSLALSTGSLPADLPAYTAGPVGGGVPLPGFVVFSAGNYGLVIDNTGRVVWYRPFPPSGPGLNFMAQPNGRYVGRPATSVPGDRETFVEVDVLGDSVRGLDCLNGRALRFHDLVVETDGGYWIMCDDTRTMDLTAYGGVAAAVVTGTVVQHVSAAGTLLLEWNTFDHFQITDVDPTTLTAASVNWTHGNSLAIDTDGNVLVSFRSLSEITKFNATTGAVIWRMGGRRNQFTFTGTPGPGFLRQHNIRVLGPARFALLDNVGGADSRFERYVVDTGTMTAQLEQSYGSTPPVTTQIGGSVQQLPADRFLVSFGTQGRVEEFDMSGTTLWRINGNPGYVFRAQRIHSLYAPGVGSAR